MGHKILLVDDDTLLLDSVRYSLGRAGYSILTATNSNEALTLARKSPPDLAILDISLPDTDGLRLCRALQADRALPVIFLTAHNREMDVILGFDHGADDYVTKPFSMLELAVRVSSVLRRAYSGTTQSNARIEIGNVLIDTVQHLVQVNGQTVEMPLKEFNLLKLLMSHAGETVDRQQLVDDIWGADYVGDSRVLDMHIRWLRELIEEDPANPRYVVTIRGVGYKFQK